MESNQPKTSIDLFIEQNKRIEQVRDDVETLMKADMNLSHKQDMTNQKLDTLTERLNEDVSKTVLATWDKVQEIAVSNEKRDIRIDSHDFWIKWMFKSVFIVIFLYVAIDSWTRMKGGG